MKQAAEEYCAAMAAGDDPYWLTLLGRSWIGKTMLAQLIWASWKQTRAKFTCPRLGIFQRRESRFVDWRLKADELQSLKASDMDALLKADFICLDDIGAEYDPSGFILGKLDLILNCRMKAWTVITSNFTLEQIATKLDIRIANRMIRGRNRIIEAPSNLRDYEERPHP